MKSKAYLHASLVIAAFGLLMTFIPVSTCYAANQKLINGKIMIVLDNGKVVPAKVRPEFELEAISKLPFDRAKFVNYLGNLKLKNPPDTYDLLRYQTPNKSQVDIHGVDWGACVAFSMTGTIEAFYKRQCMKTTPGVNPQNCDINLSEEYLVHMNSRFSTLNPVALHENWASYCNAKDQRKSWLGPRLFSGMIGVTIPTENGQQGRTLSAQQRKAFATKAGIKGCKDSDGVISQGMVDTYEYDSEHFPVPLRSGAVHAVEGSLDVDFADSSYIESLIYNDHEIASGHSWAHLVNQGNDSQGRNIWKYDPNQGCAENCGAHAIIVIGYDRPNKRYLVKNSYGSGSDYWVAYSKPDGKPFLHTGQIITKVRDVSEGPSYNAMWFGNWQIDDGGKLDRLVIRRTQRALNESNNYMNVGADPAPVPLSGNLANPPRLGTLYRNNVPHPVYGYTAENEKKLVLYVDEHTYTDKYNDKVGNMLSGTKKYELYLSSQGLFAAGTTTSGTDTRGVFLLRNELSRAYVAGASMTINDWKGLWTINVDDKYKGKLTISSIQVQTIPIIHPGGKKEIKYRYLPVGNFKYDNKSYQITGEIKGANGEVMDLKVQMTPSLNLTLHRHTGEKNFASGYTTAKAAVFGTWSQIPIPSLPKPKLIPVKPKPILHFSR